jgi:hypothetical protein
MASLHDQPRGRLPHAREASLLSARDLAVIELVGTFRQLTAEHIRVALFPELASRTPLDRTLKRLVEGGYLGRLRRLVGGEGGGSGQYIYQLGRQGWSLLKRHGHYWAPRAVNLHSLAIADCYVILREAERAGGLRLLTFTTEPECHVAVGPVTLTPDAYVEVIDERNGLKFAYFLEVDRGTERVEKIKDKCVRYWQAFQLWDQEFFPQVLFVVPDQHRVAKIGQIINAGPEAAKPLFHVGRIKDLNRAVGCEGTGAASLSGGARIWSQKAIYRIEAKSDF